MESKKELKSEKLLRTFLTVALGAVVCVPLVFAIQDEQKKGEELHKKWVAEREEREKQQQEQAEKEAQEAKEKYEDQELLDDNGNKYTLHRNADGTETAKYADGKEITFKKNPNGDVIYKSGDSNLLSHLMLGYLLFHGKSTPSGTYSSSGFTAKEPPKPISQSAREEGMKKVVPAGSPVHTIGSSSGSSGSSSAKNTTSSSSSSSKGSASVGSTKSGFGSAGARSAAS